MYASKKKGEAKKNGARGKSSPRLLSFFMKKLLCDVTGYSPNTIAQYQRRGEVDLTDIDSVANYIKEYFSKKK